MEQQQKSKLQEFQIPSYAYWLHSTIFPSVLWCYVRQRVGVRSSLTHCPHQDNKTRVMRRYMKDMNLEGVMTWYFPLIEQLLQSNCFVENFTFSTNVHNCKQSTAWYTLAFRATDFSILTLKKKTTKHHHILLFLYHAYSS